MAKRTIGKLQLLHVYPLFILVFMMGSSHLNSREFHSYASEVIDRTNQYFDRDGVPSTEARTIVSALQGLRNATDSLATSNSRIAAMGVFLIGVVSVSQAIRSRTAKPSRTDALPRERDAQKAEA